MIGGKGPLSGGETAAAHRKAQPGFQRAMDAFIRKAFLWACPTWIRPNHLTVLRLALIPVILVLLHLDHRWWALGTFVAAMSTDFTDGAMARTRDQITTFGIYMDPVADKILVAAVLAWTGYEYLVVQIILAFIVLELVLSAVGARILLRTGDARASNVFGKLKMTVQSVALLLFLVFGILDLSTGVTVALYLLWLALALGVLSGGKQIYDLAKRRPRPA